ncbi:L-type lectin-domain containing receptor kinase IV.2-like [Iris pallida]|uniref:L-type lectin-domain containing receptor kinase IV.2-like n=1 Tax=Iris pallida TaxID=29817 RepID=A0AAX6GWU2_IRIPA|nr:L-type lectin-domain containing receptor kinase IV.2-like [Iris pallida]KAJ6832974.1 L-type lectin-domain containing receptor kinase IV.2-like [Iris pallida]
MLRRRTRRSWWSPFRSSLAPVRDIPSSPRYAWCGHQFRDRTVLPGRNLRAGRSVRYQAIHCWP